MTQQNPHKSLSIRITADGLSFCVYTPTAEPRYSYHTLPVQPVMSLAANLKQALLNNSLFQDDYQRVNILLSTPEFTTVPAVEFEREHIDPLFRLVFPQSTHLHVSYNVLRRAGVAIIFGIDRHVRQLLLDDYPRARFYTAAAPLIEFLSEKSLNGHQRTLFAHIQGEQLSIYAFSQGRLLFTSSYPVKGQNDCQYFILNIWQQLGFDQSEDHLDIISEQLAQGRELADKLHYFIRHVSLVDPHEDFTLDVRNPIPYELQTLLVCGA